MPIIEMLNDSNEAIGDCSESFWEIGQYKRVVKRVDDGLKLCSELVQMLRERGEIEAAYAKMLQGWSKKWNGLIDKGAEYGSTEMAWLSAAEEARCRADLHNEIRDRLEEEVCSVLKLWSKDSFHRTAFGTIKESKEIEESFKKAQKTWAKLYGRVSRCRADYFKASRQERTAINQEKNATNSGELSAEQAKKFVEKAAKCNEERQRTEVAYKKALEALDEHRSRYQEDMVQVFKRCQEMELKRLKFFKEMLKGVHLCLDMSSKSNLKTIYANMYAVVDSMDGQKDVDFWEKTFGPGMTMNWPVFEPYIPEVRGIVKKRPSSKQGEPVMLVGQRNSIAEANGHVKDTVVSAELSSPPSDNGPGRQVSPSCNVDGPPPMADSTVESPFDDEWSDGESKPGVLVKALYDYDKQEDDELSFKKGDVFEKLEDEDEQGWCKGRKDGVTGLYPANYAVLHAATTTIQS